MIWLANFNAGPISSVFSASGQAVPAASNINIAGHTWCVQLSLVFTTIFAYINCTGIFSQDRMARMQSSLFSRPAARSRALMEISKLSSRCVRIVPSLRCLLTSVAVPYRQRGSSIFPFPDNRTSRYRSDTGDGYSDHVSFSVLCPCFYAEDRVPGAVLRTAFRSTEAISSQSSCVNSRLLP
jgi:hypothetical protein